jgi:hypothetical protein
LRHVTYELQEIGHPDLRDVLQPLISRQVARARDPRRG